MNRMVFVPALLFLAVSVAAAPADVYSVSHSTFINNNQTWSGNVLSTNTLRPGDMLAYVVVDSTGVGSVLSIWDGVDTGGRLIGTVEAHTAGYYPFEAVLSSYTAGSGQTTITKTGTGRFAITFYTRHLVTN